MEESQLDIAHRDTGSWSDGEVSRAHSQGLGLHGRGERKLLQGWAGLGPSEGGAVMKYPSSIWDI